MHKKIIIGSIVFILIAILIGFFFASPKIKESNIKTAINNANYCDVDSDCVDAGGKCPFGCYVYVNKNEVDTISKLIQSYDSQCVYGCVTEPEVVCKNNTCTPIFE